MTSPSNDHDNKDPPDNNNDNDNDNTTEFTTTFNQLDNEEKELLARLNLIKKEKQVKYEEERKRAMLQTQVVISDIEIINDRVFFKSTYREDFVEFLRKFPDRQWNSKKNSIPVTEWQIGRAHV